MSQRPDAPWSGYGIVRDDVDAYAEAHTSPQSDLLAELAAETVEATAMPQMLSGPVVGRLLETLVRLANARRVLEIGTFTGYSALAMAEGLLGDGVIDTCEIDPKHADIAQRYIDRSPHRDRITVHRGPALETLNGLPGPYNVAFIDADKTGYAAYVDAVLPKLASNGVIVLDNMLRGGLVVDAPESDESVRAIVALNDKLASDPRVVCALLTVRDGLMLVRHAT